MLLKMIENYNIIRNFVNENNLCTYFEKDSEKWNVLCASLDIFGDSLLALEEFENNNLVRNENNYLSLYGFFQAIILNQDAIRHLYLLFSNKKIEQKPDSFWKLIRKQRILIAGHPILSEGNNVSCHINRGSICSTEYELLICEKNGKKTVAKINLQNLYDGYKNEAIIYLQEIIHNQKKTQQD